jgi:hypothetical protein
VTVSACAWDGCGSEIAVNTTKLLLQKGNRVSTLIRNRQGTRLLEAFSLS